MTMNSIDCFQKKGIVEMGLADSKSNETKKVENFIFSENVELVQEKASGSLSNSKNNKNLVYMNDVDEVMMNGEYKKDKIYECEQKTGGSVAISMNEDSRNKLGKVKTNAILECNNNFEGNDLLTIVNDESNELDLLQIQGAIKEHNFTSIVSSGNHGENLGN